MFQTRICLIALIFTVYTLYLNAQVNNNQCVSPLADFCKYNNGNVCLECKDGYFGACCEKTCNYCKQDTHCERDTGTCRSCSDGLSGAFCNNTCGNSCKTCGTENPSQGRGCCDPQCPSSCPECKDADAYIMDCEATNGTCANEAMHSEFGFSLYALAAIPVTLLVIVIVLANKIRLYGSTYKKSSKGANSDDKTSSKLEERLEELDEEPTVGAVQGSRLSLDASYYFTLALNERKIPVDALEEYVRVMTDADYLNEFQSLPTGLSKACFEAIKPENVLKNRYRDIYPYDGTRVVLNDQPLDYINASYIDGYNRCRAYIACVGPTVTYMGDMSAFWRLVWQENCSTIVMLTKLVESGVRRSDRYWPEKDQGEKYGDIFVAWIGERQFEPYIIRTFNVFKRTETRVVRQLQFTDWPDQGVPHTPLTLNEFRNTVNDIRPQGDGPLLVHCSAGVGRTGTYIALDMLTREGKAEGHVDIYACVRNLREQRVKMVQNCNQYKFLHRALAYSLCGKLPDKLSMVSEKL